ncbi:hypothetical protein HYH03_005566 [Edaphochlamys debaryana]|uniref:Uncharacterized protein n=1 Tax=Edaphochlamys debaryana TaxID=47281 RepID=A0A835Y5F1_9CHLO|nr:hypothetical protein HYH03_005566 [Edaphochlamys debaryana]|eukprot:KAG2496336.1 hypothetical protein HYH03_005566 [Edaphochlamys debaryana]
MAPTRGALELLALALVAAAALLGGGPAGAAAQFNGSLGSFEDLFPEGPPLPPLPPGLPPPPPTSPPPRYPLAPSYGPAAYPPSGPVHPPPYPPSYPRLSYLPPAPAYAYPPSYPPRRGAYPPPYPLAPVAYPPRPPSPPWQEQYVAYQDSRNIYIYSIAKYTYDDAASFCDRYSTSLIPYDDAELIKGAANQVCVQRGRGCWAGGRSADGCAYIDPRGGGGAYTHDCADKQYAFCYGRKKA